ncbi:MAG TPA: TonB-dependent receptor [Luteibaculaceae bacterium]|nr:TonB-dependent receptor [Luteibaculaceae bacterium]
MIACVVKYFRLVGRAGNLPALMAFASMWLTTISLQAQRLNITGTVVDTSNQTVVKNALIMAVRLSDSTLIDFTRSKATGEFELSQTPLDTFQILVQYPGFGDQTYIVFGDPNNPVINLGKVILPPKTNGLREVVIFGYKEPVYFKGDTIVYTADSFKVSQNANVEELLKKLPGIQVDKSGAIKSQGKDVAQVLVDGDEFFGSDPTMATRNLNASSIESVEVYDKKNENAGLNASESETITVMDLKLKEDAKKGYFGKAEAGSDLDRFYQASLLANRFKGPQKVSVFGLTSNTPKSALSFSDAYEYGIDDDGFQTVETEDGIGYITNSQATEGLPMTNKLGFYFTDKLKGKNKLVSNYSFKQSSLRVVDTTLTQFFLSDTTYATADDNFNSTNNTNHQFKLNYEFKLDSLTKIELKPTAGMIDNSSTSAVGNRFISASGEETRNTRTLNTGRSKGYDLGTDVNLTRQFMKKDRKLTWNNQAKLSERDFTGRLFTQYRFNSPLIPDSVIDQEKMGTTSERQLKSNLTYTEPLSPLWKLNLGAEIIATTGNSSRSTFNAENGQYTILDSTFSNSFENERINQALIGSLVYETKKNRVQLGLSARQNTITNLNLFDQSSIKQRVQNLLPFAAYRHKFNDSKQVSINYTTSSSAPSIQQLQPLPDNTNPNFIRIGNPDLLPNFNNNFSLNYYSFSALKNRHFYGGINANFTNNASSTNTRFDNIGRTTSQTVNVDGNYNLFAYAGGMSKVTGPVSLNYNLNVSRLLFTNLINDQINQTITQAQSIGLGFDLDLDKFTANLGGDYSRNQTESSLNQQSNQSFGSFSANAGFQWELKKGFEIKSSISTTKNLQRADGFNIQYTIWNASLAKSFLKKENLTLSLDATDLLNQNIAVNRQSQNNTIVDSRKLVVGRYILINLAYRFDSNKDKPKEDEMGF